MATATTPVRVTIQPEALLLADKLGMRGPMERLIEQMKAMAPELMSIDVEVEIHPEDPTFPHLIAIDGVEPFLKSAQDLLAVGGEHNGRSALGRAYYALVHEGADALLRWGLPKPPGEQIHRFVRLRFDSTLHADFRPIGLALDQIGRFRNQWVGHLPPNSGDFSCAELSSSRAGGW